MLFSFESFRVKLLWFAGYTAVNLFIYCPEVDFRSENVDKK